MGFLYILSVGPDKIGIALQSLPVSQMAGMPPIFSNHSPRGFCELQKGGLWRIRKAALMEIGKIT